jgi:RNA polymerase sigma-70 factor, ECF subfamily
VSEEVGNDADRRARFEALVGDVLEPIRRYLARRTDPDTAEDVLADTLLVCWRRLDELPDEPLPWVYVVARNALANADRGSRRQRRLATRIAVVDPPPVSEPDEPEHDSRVGVALASLRPEEAELLRLWAWEELGPAEIAAVLGVTPNAVSIRLYRARERVKDALRKIDEAPGHEGLTEGSGP